MQKYSHLKDIPVFSTIIVCLFGLWGAILNYSKRGIDCKKRTKKQIILLFFLDVITSSGFSLLIFYGAMGFGIDEPISVMLSGFAAVEGTHTVYFAELIVAKKFGGDSVVEAIKENKEDNQNDK